MANIGVLSSALVVICVRCVRVGDGDDDTKLLDPSSAMPTVPDKYLSYDGSTTQFDFTTFTKIVHVKGLSKSKPGTITTADGTIAQMVKDLKDMKADLIVWDGDQPPVDGTNSETYTKDKGFKDFDMSDIFAQVISQAMDSIAGLKAVSFNTEVEEWGWGVDKARKAWKLYAETEAKAWIDRVTWVSVPDDTIKKIVDSNLDDNGVPKIQHWEALGAHALRQTKAGTVVSFGMCCTTEAEWERVCDKREDTRGKLEGIDVKTWYAYKASRNLGGTINEFPYADEKHTITCKV